MPRVLKQATHYTPQRDGIVSCPIRSSSLLKSRPGCLKETKMPPLKSQRGIVDSGDPRDSPQASFRWYPTERSWANLPATALRLIFEMLTDADRFSVALVCKNWKEGFNEPSLWRTRSFEFHENGKRAIRFARKFSMHLRKIEIQIIEPSYTSSASLLDLKTFSELLDTAVLKKIEIIFFKDRVFNYNKNWNEEFLIPLLKIIRKQNSLEEFSATNVSCNLRHGVQLLRCLAQTCGATLQKLVFNRFLKKSLETVHHTGPVITEIKKLSNLIEVELYSVYVTDDLLHVWSRQCPKLTLIKLFVTSEDHVLSCEAWRALVQTHAALTVEIHSGLENDDLLFCLHILSPEIPLSYLKWDMGICFDYDSELTRFLDRLAKFDKTLKGMYISFFTYFGDPDHTAVMNVLSKCSKLSPHLFERSSWDSFFWRILEVDRRC